MDNINKKIKAILQYPITIKRTIITDGKAVEKEEEIVELELGRLLLKDLRNLPVGCIDKNGNFAPEAFIPMVASSANIPIESAEQIDFRDLDEIMEKMSPFLPKSL